MQRFAMNSFCGCSVVGAIAMNRLECVAFLLSALYMRGLRGFLDCLFVLAICGMKSMRLWTATDPEDARSALADVSLDVHEVLLVPVNNHELVDRVGGSHWSLLEIHVPSRQARHYDSVARSGNEKCARRLLRCIEQTLMKGTAISFEAVQSCARQTNGCDCGGVS